GQKKRRDRDEQACSDHGRSTAYTSPKMSTSAGHGSGANDSRPQKKTSYEPSSASRARQSSALPMSKSWTSNESAGSACESPAKTARSCPSTSILQNAGTP